MAKGKKTARKSIRPSVQAVESGKWPPPAKAPAKAKTGKRGK